MVHSSLPYRPCVGIALFNDEGRVFVGERLDNLGAWQMPQGGIDPGEDIESALWRELAEEVGLKQQHAKLLEIAPQTLKYDLPPERVAGFWNGKYRGQEQSWCKLLFTGQDDDICLDSFTEPEFSQWKWEQPDNILKQIVPFKRDIYRAVFDIFS